MITPPKLSLNTCHNQPNSRTNTKAQKNIEDHPIDDHRIKEAIRLGLKDFFTCAEQSVPPFVTSHYRYPGCWQTNRVAFGLDLLRAPINLIWAPIYLCLILLISILSKVGLGKTGGKDVLRSWGNKIPSGMPTSVQRAINRSIQNELLNTSTLRSCVSQRILSGEHAQKDSVINSASIPALIQPSAEQSIHQHQHALNAIVDEALNQLMQTRTATADISNTLISAAIGALAFKKFTPGGIGIGFLLTAWWIKYQAEKNFILGEQAGSFYYTVFTPQADGWQNIIGIFIVMIIFSIFASFSGLVTDPLQAISGLHQRRLKKMIRQLEYDLIDEKNSRFKTLDPYIARILELFDTVKSQLPL